MRRNNELPLSVVRELKQIIFLLSKRSDRIFRNNTYRIKRLWQLRGRDTKLHTARCCAYVVLSATHDFGSLL